MKISLRGMLLLMSLGLILFGGTILLLEHFHSEQLKQLDSAEDGIADIHQDLLELRRYEKDFLARNDLNDAQIFDAFVVHLRVDIEQIVSILQPYQYNTQGIQKLSTLLDHYSAMFREIVSLKQQIGLTTELGATGEMNRFKRLLIERMNLVEPESRLHFYWISAMQHVPVFFQQKSAETQLRLMSAMDTLQQQVDVEISKSTELNDLQALLMDYRTALETVIKYSARLGFDHESGLQGAMRKSAHQFEAAAVDQFTSFRQFAESEEEQLHDHYFYTAFATFVVLVLWGGLISIAINRSTTRLLDQIKGIVGSADYRSRIVIEGSNEISEISEAFNQVLGWHEEQMETSKKLLKSKDDFLATMSHELRTPLTAIIGNTEHLQESGNCGGSLCQQGDAQQVLSAISSAGKHQLALVNDILDLSKIESGKFTLDFAPFDLTSLLNDLKHMFEVTAQDRGILFEIEQQLSPKYQLWGDGKRIGQILINLIGNAIKFTEEGEVKLTCSKEGGQFCFVVEDSGIGMDQETLARLFKPFEQADSSISRRYGGTGLGLHISRVLAEQMEGMIEVVSVPGEGSTFTFRVPLQESELLAEQEIEGDGNSSVLEQQFSGYVLAVEDTIELQILVRRVLESFGLTVTIANNGKEALQIAGQHHFDLILMDMQMPIMDGLEATTALRERGDQTPIVALTANVMQQHRKQFDEAGGNEFLQKPIDKAELSRILNRYLNRGQSRLKTLPNPAKEIVQSYETAPYPLLVIDDEQSVLDLYKAVLEGDQPFAEELDSLGIERQDPGEFELTTARQGREGVEMACQALNQGRPYPVAFIDMKMPPGMTGLETAKALRRLDREIQIVIVTAHSDVDLTTINRELGRGVLFVQKPFSGEIIAQMARNMVQRWNQEEKAFTHLPVTAEDFIVDKSGAMASLDTEMVDEAVDDELIEIFRESAANYNAALKTALAKKDWGELRKVAHTVKGSAASFGFFEISRRAGIVQSVIDEEKIELVPQLTMDLMVELGKIL